MEDVTTVGTEVLPVVEFDPLGKTEVGEDLPQAEPALKPGETHLCRQPEFNAMVETCPACGVPEPLTARAEVAASQFRHVEASRWLVHHLLEFHYLPYWPRNVDRVYATVDIKTGRVVAACVFAFPCLRSHLRELVFGLLRPETLNKDFRQLVRWMVHPEYRSSKLGTELLRWAFARLDAPVVEAINRSWVPVAVFKELGMVERADGRQHYYYRLKDCRKRIDEIKDVPEQADNLRSRVVHMYPRIWVQRFRLEGQAKIIFSERYEGARVQTHYWKEGGYIAAHEREVDVGVVEQSPLFFEVVDPVKRKGYEVEIAGGLAVESARLDVMQPTK